MKSTTRSLSVSLLEEDDHPLLLEEKSVDTECSRAFDFSVLRRSFCLDGDLADDEFFFAGATRSSVCLADDEFLAAASRRDTIVSASCSNPEKFLAVFHRNNFDDDDDSQWSGISDDEYDEDDEEADNKSGIFIPGITGKARCLNKDRRANFAKSTKASPAIWKSQRTLAPTARPSLDRDELNVSQRSMKSAGAVTQRRRGSIDQRMENFESMQKQLCGKQMMVSAHLSMIKKYGL